VWWELHHPTKGELFLPETLDVRKEYYEHHRQPGKCWCSGTSYRSPGLKHVGDGALSDSDSSGNEEDHEDGLGGDDEPESTPDPANDEGPEGDMFRRPNPSPYLFPRNPASHRSPLSKS
jgi:hypothetical protein